MSSPNHPTSDIVDAFFSNSPEYISASLDYFPASPGNISPNSSNDLTKYLLTSLAISPYHNDPYIIQAYNAIPPPQAIIALPTVLPLSLVLSLPPMFDSRDFFSPEKISPPKDTENPFATGTLIEEALSWWNSFAQPIGIEEAYKITWVEFKKLLIKKYCPRTKIQKMEDEFYHQTVKGNDLKTY
nr:reverse transcriptase domain-containing protein [Tanacetum cinerariifolium]